MLSVLIGTVSRDQGGHEEQREQRRLGEGWLLLTKLASAAVVANTIEFGVV